MEDLQEELEGTHKKKSKVRIYSDFVDLKCSRARKFLNLNLVCCNFDSHGGKKGGELKL